MYQKLTTLIISLAFFSTLSAEIAVKSFRKLENDMTARIDAPKKDQNGDICAIIKVVTTQTGFIWEPDGLGIVSAESKAGEYWLYVPYGAKRMTIKHAQLGVLRDYMYTLPIEKATVYEMVLITGKVTTIVEESIPTKFLVITTYPAGADVFINEQHQGQTPFQKEMMVGEYTYRISKDLYYPIAGKVDLSLGTDKELFNYQLKPNYGFLQINSKPEDGMSVMLEGRQLTQTTPLKTDTLKSGKYSITVSKNQFYPLTKEVVVQDNQTTPIEFDLRPTFGSLTIDSSPESNASITLDGKTTGQFTPYRYERLMAGEYTLTVRKEWYEPKTIKIRIEEGKEQKQTIELAANFGTVKLSTDPESELYIDNELKGKGNWEGRLLTGLHSFEAKKLSHRTSVQKTEISANENKLITLQPQPMIGKLKIVSNAIGATIKLNGKEYGTTPAIINELLVGDYVLQIEKEGYKPLTKTISIQEAKTLELNDNLYSDNQSIVRAEPVFTPQEKPTLEPEIIDEKTKISARTRLKSFYKEHFVSIAYGLHATQFVNSTFKERISSGIINYDFGHAATISATLFPVEMSASLFSSGFRIHESNKVIIDRNTNSQINSIEPYVNNGIIKHRGIELAVNFIPFNIGSIFLPYIGVGYQLSQVYSPAESLTIGEEVSTSTSLPIVKGGLKIKAGRIFLFGEYKRTIFYSGSDYQSNQASAGVGFTF